MDGKAIVYRTLVIGIILQNLFVVAEYDCHKLTSQWNNHCYFKVNGAYVTYPKAQFLCKAVNASIVSIESAEENNFVRNLSDPYSTYWIDIKPNINANKNAQQTADNSGYSNWDISKTMDAGNGNCTIFNSVTGFWESVNCTNYASVICEKDFVPIIDEQKPSEIYLSSTASTPSPPSPSAALISQSSEILTKKLSPAMDRYCSQRKRPKTVLQLSTNRRFILGPLIPTVQLFGNKFFAF
ncbi:unnamed protein product [Enterobius vermicularis]|uniref:C-type lectin domain-containing protein n=1 Tax=Enterobius vermicularis TaxID=51028 RepID=A0A0N4UTP4_ENTVE|nr:unnamed protein product [Enterobius vermicularis]